MAVVWSQNHLLDSGDDGNWHSIKNCRRQLESARVDIYCGRHCLSMELPPLQKKVGSLKAPVIEQRIREMKGDATGNSEAYFPSSSMSSDRFSLIQLARLNIFTNKLLS